MMKIHLVNVSDVDESMRMQLRMWRNSDAVSPFFLLDQVTEDQHPAIRFLSVILLRCTILVSRL